MLTAANYAETCEEVTAFTKELLLPPPLAEAQNPFPRAGATVAPRQGESPASGAERAVERPLFYAPPVLPRAPVLLCNSKQYEL